jgi:hypothetical protein
MLIWSYYVYAGKSDDLVKEGCNETSDLVVCFGELLIDFVPTVGGVSLAEAPAFKKAPGGAPANVAVGISKLGGSSAFIGKVYIYMYLSWWLFGFLLLSAGLPCLICVQIFIFKKSLDQGVRLFDVGYTSLNDSLKNE